ncbi:hypothetical protein ESCO_006030 [Escovopsis weberi]|uniref:CipC-like antibiotic response protein n=1 Tax=Escovopsis weberi TaxID=150374 RepID=A0A0M8MYN2_ESCWE|nr:hypothetical protein ESCO_006030 [Escovopsis weberi]
MGFFSSDHDVHRHEEAYNSAPKHEAHLSHELMGGAAAAYAAKKVFDKKAEDGKPVAHAGAYEALAGVAGAFIDREFETKGLDFIDKQKAKRHAEQLIKDEHERHGSEGRTHYERY